MSKGHAPRQGRDDKAFAAGWEATFGKKAESEQALQELTDLSQEMGLYDAKPVRITGNFRCKVNGLDMLNDAGFEIVTQPGFDYVLEAIEQPAKTCQHCKHWNANYIGQPLGWCERVEVMAMTSDGFSPPADFSCGLWEAKP